MRLLDEVDIRILDCLQQNGRASFSEIAAHCEISQSTCFDRIKRLENERVIQGYSAIIDPKRVSLPLLIFSEVNLERTTSLAMREFSAATKAIPEIMECHLVSGGFDYLLKMRVRDMDHYKTLLSDSIANLPYVRGTHTYVVMDENIETARLPLSAAFPPEAGNLRERYHSGR